MSADWQRFTHDPEDTNATERCAFPSHGHGSHRGHDGCQTCAETMGICLRRRGHPSDWHEGRSRSGNLVSWPADDRSDYEPPQPPATTAPEVEPDGWLCINCGQAVRDGQGHKGANGIYSGCAGQPPATTGSEPT